MRVASPSEATLIPYVSKPSLQVKFPEADEVPLPAADVAVVEGVPEAAVTLFDGEKEVSDTTDSV